MELVAEGGVDVRLQLVAILYAKVEHRSLVVPEPLLYRLSRICTKTVQREKQSKSIREREIT